MSYDSSRLLRSLTPVASLPALCLALSFLALACGNKGRPQPPPRMIAAPTRDLVIQQRGKELILSFTYPTVTVAGFTLGPLQAVELWELSQELAPEELMDDFDEPEFDPLADVPQTASTKEKEADPRPEARIIMDTYTFGELAQIKLTMSDAELTSAVAGEKIIARLPLDDEVAAGETGLIYSVRTISSRGLASNFSNLAVLVPRETPPAPTPFEVLPGPAFIELRWGEQEEVADAPAEAPEEGTPLIVGLPPLPTEAEQEEQEPEEREDGILSYRLYRRDAQARYYGDPLDDLAP